MADEVQVITDFRALSVRLREAIPKGEWEKTSLEIGQSKNFISRCISWDPIPGPDKYPVLADLLKITVFEVGGAVALDQVARRQARLAR